ncbi:MAG: InlB B-repeat-containing protein [Oscillospiraceae bacterium]|nr:InlB B-repeat-containing protein [Oscillospiraceae bacterium]
MLNGNRRPWKAILSLVLCVGIILGQMGALTYAETEDDAAPVAEETADAQAQDAAGEETAEQTEEPVAAAVTEAETSLAQGTSITIEDDWIDWYTGAAPSYTIDTAEELYGLVYLVQEGADFTDTTITLGASIDLTAVAAAGTALQVIYDTTPATEDARDADEQTTADAVEATPEQTDTKAEEEAATDEADENGDAADVSDEESTTEDEDTAEETPAAEDEFVAGEETAAEEAPTDDDTDATDTTDTASYSAAADIDMVFAPKGQLLRAAASSLITPASETETLMTWEPIGTSDTPFNGTFDGGNNTITLGIDSTADYQALFGYTGADAVIENLTVSGSVKGGNFTAAVVASNKGTIRKVTNDASVTVETLPTATDVYIGGVAAYSTGGLQDITNRAGVTVTAATAGATTNTNIFIGGVAGYSVGVISGTDNNGNVTVTTTDNGTSARYRYTGGIVGKSTAALSDVNNTGEVSVNSPRAATTGSSAINYVYTGGIAGYSESAISDAVNSAHVTGISNGAGGRPYGYTGGIAGYTKGAGTHLENTGNVKTELPRTGMSTGAIMHAASGGIFGFTEDTGTISHAYNEGTVASSTLTAATRYCYAGGIVGYGATTGFLYCYNTGDVTTVSANTVTNGGAGGLLGYPASSTAALHIENCYNTGAIGTANVGYNGGLVGGVRGATLWLNCYNSGAVTSATANYGPFGYNITSNTTIVNCYYNNEAYTTEISGATGLSKAELQDASFPEKLGFAYAGQTGDYPALHYYADPTDDVVTLNYQETEFYRLGKEKGLVTYEILGDTEVRAARDGEGKITEPENMICPANEHIVFQGWYYADGITEADFEEAIDADSALYAKWALETVNVTFDYNDAESNPTTVVVAVDYSYPATVYVATRDGYELIGWYRKDTTTGAISGTLFDFSTALTSDVYLVAKWQQTALAYDWYEQQTGDTYTITTPDELRAFARLVNGTAEQDKAALDFSGKTVQLANSIDLGAGNDWLQPIGTADTPFNGTFEGGGYTVSNMRADTQSGYNALFGYTGTDAAVRNLTVDGTIQSGLYTAGVVAYNTGALQNVTNKAAADITELPDAARVYIGGVAAYNAGPITGADNQGNITLHIAGTQSAAAYRYIGGIAGYSTGALCDVQNTGAVTAAFTASIAHTVYTGGIAGNTTGTIASAENTGAISGQVSAAATTTQYTYTGGLIGYTTNTAAVSDVGNEGDVTGKTDATTPCAYAGGLIAYSGTLASLSTAYNTGDVVAEATTGATRRSFAGGLIGYGGASAVLYAYNTGNVASSGATVATYGSAGGLIGYFAGIVQFEYCYNVGAIAKGEGEAAYAGGLAGYVLMGTWLNCYNAGSAMTGQLYGHAESANMENSYYNTGLIEAGITDAAGRSDAEMKGADFAGELGYAYAAQEDAYPALHCAVDPTENVVTFNYQESTLYAVGGSQGLVPYDRKGDTLVRVALDEGGMAAAPEVAVPYAGISCAGWYDADGAEVDFDSAMTAGATLYATWARNGIVVTYDYNYEDENGESVVTYAGVSLGDLTEFMTMEREGYELVCWYEKDLETGELSDTPFDFETRTLYTSVYLVAAWQDMNLDYTWYENPAEPGEYIIESLAQLNAFTRLVNGTAAGYEAAVSFTGERVYLGGDIDMNEAEEGFVWLTPIGTADTPFLGTFDGQGHTVSNLKISSKESYQALFGYAGSGAAIQNLTVTGEVVVTAEKGANYIAGVVAYNGAALHNVTSEISITYTGASTVATLYLGGVTANTTGALESVYHAGDITVETTDVLSSAMIRYVGGVTGYSTAALTDVTHSGEMNLTFDKTISQNSALTIYAGGVTGNTTKAITNAANEGDLAVSVNAASIGPTAYVGGIMGGATTSAGTVNDAENSGNIISTVTTASTTSATSAYAAGIAGARNGSAASGLRNTGDVTAKGHTAYAGGLLGYGNSASGELTGSYNTGNITAEATTQGAASRTARAGGLSGYRLPATISLCYNTGDVTATGASAAAYGGAGGLAGGMAPSAATTYSNCYNTGTITGDSVVVAGGLQGHSTTNYDVVWINCYNAGYASTGQLYGLLPKSATVYNCYYNADNGANMIGSVGTATGYSADAMKAAAFARKPGLAYTAQSGDYPTLCWVVDPQEDVVTFDFQQGTAAFTAIRTDASGVTYTEPSTQTTVSRNADGTVTPPDVTGWDVFGLVGWYYDTACTQAVDFSDPVDAGETLYAGWARGIAEITYDLGYEGADASTAPAAESIAFGACATMPTPPERSGYTFVGWFVKDPDTGTLAGTPLDFTTKIYGDTCLVACWVKDPIDADYDWYMDEKDLPEPEYVIETSGALYALAKLVNGEAEIGGVPQSAVDFTGETVTLGRDIALDGIWVVPIGTADHPFRGVFDGGGTTISKLQGISSNTTEGYAGLFGYVEGATIRNVTLSGSVAGGSAYIGSVAAYVLGGADGAAVTTIADVTVNTTVSGTKYVGGLVGYAAGALKLTACHYTGTVTGSSYAGGMAGCVAVSDTAGLDIADSDNTGKVTGINYVGGLVGCLDDAAAGSAAAHSTVTGSGNTGVIAGAQYVGGLLGYGGTNLTVSDCGNEEGANISGTGYVGGLLGGVKDTVAVRASYHDAAVQNSGDYTGGLIGYAEAGLTLGDEGDADSGVWNGGGIDGGNYVGGLVGRTGDDAVLCYAENQGTVCGGKQYVGGLVGSAGENTVLSNAANSADVSGNDQSKYSTSSYSAYAGGLIGASGAGLDITDAANDGDVTGCGSYVGGLVAYAASGLHMEEVENTGRITALACGGSSNPAGSIGGLVGFGGAGAEISYAKNSGKVTDDALQGTNVGGIAGLLGDEATLYETYNYGDVKGLCSNTYTGLTGGLVGQCGDSIEIDSCGNEGTVRSSGDMTGGLVGANATAKFPIPRTEAGVTYTTASNSSATITITQSYNAGAVSGSRCIGGLVGCGFGTVEISGCENANSISGALGVGGLVGASRNDLVVEDSINTSDGTVNGQGVGGIVGYAYGYVSDNITLNAALNMSVTIDGCTNEGAIKGTSTGHGNGGLIGYGYSTGPVYELNITQSQNTGDVTGVTAGGVAGALGTAAVTIGAAADGAPVSDATISGGSGTGGLIGKLTGSTLAIEDVKCAGELVTYLSGGTGRGGFLGTAADSEISIRGSYSAVQVTGTSDVGGLIGAATGTILTMQESGNRESVSAGYNTGGLVGRTDAASTLTMLQCYNEGSVSTTGNDAYYTGGLIGVSGGGLTMTACHNAGDITSANKYIGGLVGALGDDGSIAESFNWGDIQSDTVGLGAAYIGAAAYLTGAGTIENSYGSGVMTAEESDAVIGFAVSDDAQSLQSITDCYYLAEAESETDPMAKTEAAFQSGELAYLLDGGARTPHLDAWTQGVDDSGDARPVPGTPSYYQTAVGSAQHVTVQLMDTASAVYASAGTQIQMTVVPDAYEPSPDDEEEYEYVITRVTVTQDGTPQILTETDGAYSFTMPDSNAVVSAQAELQPLTAEIVTPPATTDSSLLKKAVGAGSGLGSGNGDGDGNGDGSGDNNGDGDGQNDTDGLDDTQGDDDKGQGDQGVGENDGASTAGQDDRTASVPSDTTRANTEDISDVPVPYAASAEQELREEDGSAQEATMDVGGGGQTGEEPEEETPAEEVQPNELDVSDPVITQLTEPQTPVNYLLILLIVIVIAAVLIVSGIYNYRRKKRS